MGEMFLLTGTKGDPKGDFPQTLNLCGRIFCLEECSLSHWSSTQKEGNSTTLGG